MYILLLRLISEISHMMTTEAAIFNVYLHKKEKKNNKLIQLPVSIIS